MSVNRLISTIMRQSSGARCLIVRKSAGGALLKGHCNLLLWGLVPLLVAFPFGLRAQESDCPKEPLLLSPSDPVYSEAMGLKQTLESHGFVVRCVFPTKLGSIFRVDEGGGFRSTVEGEANLRTNYGEVDVVFLPKSQTFADFKITERREGGGYMYTFGGTPRVWETNRFGSALRMYFLDQDNMLLFISDAALMRRLEQVLQVRHRKL